MTRTNDRYTPFHYTCFALICAMPLVAKVFPTFTIGSGSVATTPHPQTVEEKYGMGVAAGMQDLIEGLRDPASFQPATVTLLPDGTTCITYRARNGFNGMNLGRAIITFEPVPPPPGVKDWKDPPLVRTLRDETSGGFARLWAQRCVSAAGGHDITAAVRNNL